jgi:hypothetical protein
MDMIPVSSRRISVIAVAVIAMASGSVFARPSSAASTAVPGLSAAAWSATSIGSIDAKVFDLAREAAVCAVHSGDAVNPSTLTVIDYSKPSTAKRLWVFDLHTHQLLFNELVAHGQGSGDNVATSFSNDTDTHQSSLGLYVAEDTYIGKNGYSLRLNGLDRGFNDHALARAIVMHGASYVSEVVTKMIGRLGRSWGCPALSTAVAHAIIDRVKGGGLVFAYYPDQKWLASSKYLNGCDRAGH